MRQRALLFGIGLLAAALGQAQLVVTEGQTSGFTQYQTESSYGFPCSVIFSDSHSAFIASFLSGAPGEITLYNDLAPTDESPDTKVEAIVKFNVPTATNMTYTADSTGAYWLFLIEDENFNLFYSDEDGATRNGSFLLNAGSYQMRYFTDHNFWNGGSFMHSGLQMQGSPVPEPATMLILAPAALLLRKRRRNQGV